LLSLPKTPPVTRARPRAHLALQSWPSRARRAERCRSGALPRGGGFTTKTRLCLRVPGSICKSARAWQGVCLAQCRLSRGGVAATFAVTTLDRQRPRRERQWPTRRRKTMRRRAWTVALVMAVGLAAPSRLPRPFSRISKASKPARVSMARTVGRDGALRRAGRETPAGTRCGVSPTPRHPAPSATCPLHPVSAASQPTLSVTRPTVVPAHSPARAQQEPL